MRALTIKHNYKEKHNSNCVKIPILDIILFPLKHTYRSVLVSSSALIAIIILCMIKDHSYLSNIKHSVSLYGEQIIIVFVLVVIIARWEGDWRKLPWTGMSLQIGNPVKMYFYIRLKKIYFYSLLLLLTNFFFLCLSFIFLMAAGAGDPMTRWWSVGTTFKWPRLWKMFKGERDGFFLPFGNIIDMWLW